MRVVMGMIMLMKVVSTGEETPAGFGSRGNRCDPHLHPLAGWLTGWLTGWLQRF
jgi:hypothetical protein